MDNKKKLALKLFYGVAMLTALGLALSDGVFSNYFKEAYDVTPEMRGFIEFPRELPGLCCVLVVSLLSFMGELRMAMVAQILSVAGLIALGFLTPTFAVMLIFLFINSMGMHLFFPLQDGIALSLIGDKDSGKGMGRINGAKTAASLLGSVIVFSGFRFGVFSLTSPIKWVFVIALVLFAIVFFLLMKVRGLTGDLNKVEKTKLVIRKEYKFYYILAAMAGAQKQIMYVYGPWVIIDILGKKADTLAVLAMVGAFIGIFFVPMVGRWLDKYGLVRMLYLDALSFIGVYILYGLISSGFSTGILATVGIPVLLMYVLYIMDKMSWSLGIVRVMYLRSIAKDKSEITKTLSTGISMDHFMSIVSAYLGGLTWKLWGPQYVFYIAAVLSLVNLVVARLVQKQQKNVGAD